MRKKSYLQKIQLEGLVITFGAFLPSFSPLSPTSPPPSSPPPQRLIL